MEKRQQPAIIHQILLNRPIRILLTIALCAIVVPIGVLVLFHAPDLGYPEGVVIGTCGHTQAYHVPCGPIDINQKMCTTRGCCYSEQFGCYHFFPSQFVYTSMISASPLTISTQQINALLVPLRSMTPLGETSELLQFRLTEVSDHRLKIELGIGIPGTSNKDVTNDGNRTRRYRYEIDRPALLIRVTDRTDGRLLLTSARGPLIASERYFEWSLHLGTDILLGLGETILKQRPMKKLLLVNENNSIVPYIIGFDTSDNSFRAIVFKGFGPIEVEISKTSLISFRMMSSRLFAVDLIMGSTPGNVLTEIRTKNADFSRPPPEYWSLGIQICRKSMNNISDSIKDLSEFMIAAKSLDIPYDSHCIQEDLQLFGAETHRYNELLNESIVNLKKESKKFVFSVLSQIDVNNEVAYKRSIRNQILIRKENSDDPYQGMVNGKPVVYVDWTAGSIGMEDWMDRHFPFDIVHRADQLQLQTNCLRDESSVVRREPSSRLYQFIPTNLSSLADRLVPASLRLAWNAQSHSIVPYYNLMSTRSYPEWIQEQLTQNASIVVTHWNAATNERVAFSQNGNATWIDLRRAFAQMQSDSVSGLRISGSAVCGGDDSRFVENVDEELCLRWYQMASLSPLFKVYATSTPDKFSIKTAQFMISAMRRRYSLLGYMNTVLLLTDDPLVKPLYYNYPELLLNQSDIHAEHFMLGNGIVVAPVLRKGVIQKDVFMPYAGYELWGGERQPIGWHPFWVVAKDLPIFVLAGHIIPVHVMVHAAQTATDSRTTPLSLMVALECVEVAVASAGEESTVESVCQAKGQYALSKSFKWIFEADREKITITFSRIPIQSLICSGAAKVTAKVSRVKIYDPHSATRTVQLNFDLCKEKTILSKYILFY